MATTTPNYGWTVPTSTDLVKDGATAIETLGDAIDASMNTALGTKKAGMVLLNTTSFSGVASVSLTADTFTATYDDYRLIYELTSYATDGTYSIRLRAAGSDSSASNYSNAVMFSRTNNTSGNVFANKGQTSWSINAGDSGTNFSANAGSFDIISPKAAYYTKLTGFTTGITTDAAEFQGNFNTHIFAATTSFDSLSFIFPGNSAGRISVYGYSK